MVATYVPALLLISAVIASPFESSFTKRAASAGPALGTSCEYTVVAGAALTVGATVTMKGDVTTGAALTGYTSAKSGSLVKVLADSATAISNVGGLSGPTVAMFGTGIAVNAGVYSFAAAASFPAVLNLIGGVDDIFVFQANGAINFAASSVVSLTGGVQAKNVYFYSLGATTVGASSIIKGNIFSTAAVTLGASVQLTGNINSLAATTIGASCTITPILCDAPAPSYTCLC